MVGSEPQEREISYSRQACQGDLALYSQTYIRREALRIGDNIYRCCPMRTPARASMHLLCSSYDNERYHAHKPFPITPESRWLGPGSQCLVLLLRDCLAMA